MAAHDEFVEWSAVRYEAGANFAAILNEDPVVAHVMSGCHRGTVSLTGKRTIFASRKHVKRRMTRRLVRGYGKFRAEMRALSDRVVEKSASGMLDPTNSCVTSARPILRFVEIGRARRKTAKTAQSLG